MIIIIVKEVMACDVSPVAMFHEGVAEARVETVTPPLSTKLYSGPNDPS